MPVIGSTDGLNTMHGAPPNSLFAIRRGHNLPEQVPHSFERRQLLGLVGNAKSDGNNGVGHRKGQSSHVEVPSNGDGHHFQPPPNPAPSPTSFPSGPDTPPVPPPALSPPDTGSSTQDTTPTPAPGSVSNTSQARNPSTSRTSSPGDSDPSSDHSRPSDSKSSTQNSESQTAFEQSQIHHITLTSKPNQSTTTDGSPNTTPILSSTPSALTSLPTAFTVPSTTSPSQSSQSPISSSATFLPQNALGSSNKGSIAGGVVGALAGVALVIVVFILIRRRARRRYMAPSAEFMHARNAAFTRLGTPSPTSPMSSREPIMY